MQQRLAKNDRALEIFTNFSASRTVHISTILYGDQVESHLESSELRFSSVRSFSATAPSASSCYVEKYMARTS